MLAQTFLPSLILALTALGSPVERDVTLTASSSAVTVIASSSAIPTTVTFSSGVASSIITTVTATSAAPSATTFTVSSGIASSFTTVTATTVSASSGIVSSFTTAFPSSGTLAPSGTTTAAPAPTPTDPCNALLAQCRLTNPSPNYSNVYYEPSCVAAVTCFNGVPADAVIGTLSGTALPAVQQPRLSKTLFDFFSSDKVVWTQQNYIDFIYSTLGRKETPGPWPSSASVVIAQWELVVAWTGFCGTRAVPYSNFADWLQYASTNHGATSCGGAVSSSISTVTATPVPTSTAFPSSSGIASSFTSIAFPSSSVITVTGTAFPSSSLITVTATTVPSSSLITVSGTAVPSSSLITVTGTAVPSSVIIGGTTTATPVPTTVTFKA